MPALHQGRWSTCRRHCAHVKVCRATSRPVCCSHCTDRPLLSRAAGSITIPTGIDRSIGPEQLGSSAVRSACRRAAIVGSCGGHGHTRECGDRTAGALHVHVWSCPVACALYACTQWALRAVQLKRSAQSAVTCGAVHLFCCIMTSHACGSHTGRFSRGYFARLCEMTGGL